MINDANIELTNMPELVEAIRAVHQATDREMTDIINKTCKDVAYRAASFTPKATDDQIERDLRKDKIALKMASTKLRKRIGKTFTKTVKTKGGPKVKTLTINRITRRQIGTEARRMIARRKKRKGFARSGWLAALVKMGGRTVRSDNRIISKTVTGDAKPATISNLIGEVWNNVYTKLKGRAASRTAAMMESALQKAVDFVANDMKEYAERKLTEKMVKLFAGK